MGAEEQRRYIDSLKREASTLRSALEARGVVLRDVVAFYRVWNGFAATVSTRDLARLNSPGVRVRTVRRAYPASGEPVPVPGKPELERAGPERAAAGRGARHGRRQRRARRATPTPATTPSTATAIPRPGRDPGGSARRETSGTALAGVVAAAGERVLPIRIASLRAAGGTVEASTTTDQLIAGLEHAVDPNGDADTSDHVPVALVGVNAPYAGLLELARGAGRRGRRGARDAGRRARRQRGRGRAGQRHDRLARVRAARRSRSAR